VLGNKLITRRLINSCLFLISLFCLLLLVPALQAQSKEVGNIDFEIDNEKISSALNRLANEAQLNFTYDAGDSLFETKVNYTAVNKPPLVILDDLLSNSNHNYKQIGNQIVIFKDKDNNQQLVSPEPESTEEIAAADGVIIASSYQIDTIFESITDTVFILDTVFKLQTDTLLITDTVFIEKEKPENPAKSKYKSKTIDYFNPQIARDYGWSGGVFFAPVLSNFSLANQTNTLSIRNFSLGVEVSKAFNKWNVSAGLKLTHFGENFNYSYSVTEGGFFVTDTIDEYYTVTQSDTSWFYVTDSTWKPVDNQEYTYDINNRIGYLEFSASVSYDYFTNRKYRLYAKVGAQMGVLIYSSGIAIPDANEPEGVDFADINFSTTSYSILLGTGIKYRIHDHFDINSELYYFSNFNEVVIDYPISKKISGLGLKLGVIYYF